MKSLILILALTLGTVAMIAVMLFCRRYYQISVRKILHVAVLLTLTGYAGAKLMAFIESGSINGQSFFGSVFFTPLLMLLVALIFRIPCGELLDLCAPSECIMLALMKADCLINGCCKGRIIGYRADNTIIRFPSQAVELANALLIMIVLILLMRSGKNKNCIYPWYMIIYGVTRFLLNLLRETDPFIWILPAGNFWSLIAVITGVILLIVIKKHTSSHNKRIDSDE